jgi:hypothetical protein
MSTAFVAATPSSRWGGLDGPHSDEILRVIESLRLTDNNSVCSGRACIDQDVAFQAAVMVSYLGVMVQGMDSPGPSTCSRTSTSAPFAMTEIFFTW